MACSIIPLGVVSVCFIIIQPPLIGALCTLCILQAVVVLIPYSIDGVLATIQYLWRAKGAGEAFWRTSWMGGPAPSENQTPEPDLGRPAWELLKEFAVGGVNFPWTLVASAVLGALLMTTPAVFGTVPPHFFSGHIAGRLINIVAVIAPAEIVRLVRFHDVVLRAWIEASPLLLDGAGIAGTTSAVAIGWRLPG